MEFDESVDRYGAAVAGAGGVEGGQEGGPPAAECSSEPGDLGDRATGEAADDLDREFPPDTQLNCDRGRVAGGRYTHTKIPARIRPGPAAYPVAAAIYDVAPEVVRNSGSSANKNRSSAVRDHECRQDQRAKFARHTALTAAAACRFSHAPVAVDCGQPQVPRR